MEIALHFMLKALFILKIFTFWSWLFGHVEKRFDKKAMVNFKIYDITDWTTDNYSTDIAQYLTNQRKPDNEIWSVDRI